MFHFGFLNTLLYNKNMFRDKENEIDTNTQIICNKVSGTFPNYKMSDACVVVLKSDISHVDENDIVHFNDAKLCNYIKNTNKYFMMARKCGVYVWRNKITNKCYVGQTINKWDRYCRFILCLSNPHYCYTTKKNKDTLTKIDIAIRDYNDLSQWEYTFTECSKSELNQIEQDTINKLNSITNGYNEIDVTPINKAA